MWRGVVGAGLPTDEHHHTVLRVDKGEESAGIDDDDLCIDDIVIEIKEESGNNGNN